MSTYAYDPGRLTGAFHGIPFTGLAQGSMVTAERAEDGASMEPGGAGDVVTILNRNRIGAVTVRFLAGSPTNALLSALVKTRELFGGIADIGALLFKDLNSTTVVHADVARIRKIPTIQRDSDGAPVCEWVFDCAELEVDVGAAAVIL
jgi:hypothetical protein